MHSARRAEQCYAPFGAEPPIVECHQSVTRSSQADASRLKALFGIKFKHSKASDLTRGQFRGRLLIFSARCISVLGIRYQVQYYVSL